MKHPRVSSVVALGRKTHAIGNNNKLLWDIPEDLKRFKRITLNEPVIMGRKTLESILSILGKPLPGRVNIVITRQTDYDSKGAQTVSSLEEAFEAARAVAHKEIFVIGGQQIYEQALPKIERLYLTLVDSDNEGDTWFPPYEDTFTQEVEREEKEYKGLTFTWLTLDRT